MTHPADQVRTPSWVPMLLALLALAVNIANLGWQLGWWWA